MSRPATAGCRQIARTIHETACGMTPRPCVNVFQAAAHVDWIEAKLRHLAARRGYPSHDLLPYQGAEVVDRFFEALQVVVPDDVSEAVS